MSLSLARFLTARVLLAERGQGTVEYVGIVLAVAALLVAVAAAIDNKVGGPIASALVHRLQEAGLAIANEDTMAQAIHDVYCGVMADHSHPSEKDHEQARSMIAALQKVAAGTEA